MNELKEYKPITLVFYIDWNGERNALPLDDTKREAFKKAVETSKMVELEWITINTFDIKEIRPADKTSEIEKMYYSQPRSIRAKISWRTRVMTHDNKMNAVEYFSSITDRERAIKRLGQMIEALQQDLQPKD